MTDPVPFVEEAGKGKIKRPKCPKCREEVVKAFTGLYF